MCRAVRCKTCGKTTWAGCGEHVAEVRRTVPAAQWCSGHPKEQTQGGFFSRMFQR
ncbi:MULTISPECIES: hypothetical protein [Microbacterium]|uniref:hypothetical protein n=1 Tax=Microbacterium TaxID=33882 RepID=UPI000CBD6F6E|nr:MULTISPECIES: hypothetical protein [Microbacterium]MCK8476171.1 hypothetical protein [Microbacterium aurugineum]PKQ35007.1 MAG: hypothetical protein CVT61_08070 [Actinobacteria bacterium HGW-Actinobacteria-11]